VSRVVAVNPSLVVERVGSDYLMLTASGAEVVRATGDAADVITCAINGQPLPDHLHTAADVLQRHGVLKTTTSVTTANTFTPSRRHALQLGAAAAAVGLTMLALPNAAAAASEAFMYTATYDDDHLAEVPSGCGSDGISEKFEIVFLKSGTFEVTAGSRMAIIFLIGGGGSGSSPAAGGGGGGGGGMVSDTNDIQLTVGSYDITVGAGGAAVTGPSDGLPGGETSVLVNGETFIATGGEGGAGGVGGDSGFAFASEDNEPGSGGVAGGVDGLNGGGGGGAGGDGLPGDELGGGRGGEPLQQPFFGTDIRYLAEGGCGGGESSNAGNGFGGDGGTLFTAATGGVANTGSGGGGGYDGSTSGAGGSGMVVIRFSVASCPLPG